MRKASSKKMTIFILIIESPSPYSTVQRNSKKRKKTKRKQSEKKFKKKTLTES